MSEILENLKNWLDKVYSENFHIACLELPILKILVNHNGWLDRNEIINQLSEYGSFERGSLSFDHLWSQRFGKGEEKDILNQLIEHNGQSAGDVKTQYKVKDEIKGDLKQFLDVYNANIKELIQKRLFYVSDDYKKFQEICNCLDSAIKESNNKLQLVTNTGTKINLEKQNNSNYKITFNTEKSSYESITLENLYKFLFEEWRGNETLNRDDNRITLFEAIKSFIYSNCSSKDKDEKIKVNQQGNPKMSNYTKQTQPLNQILYGSPGTGKTYTTINKALEIIFQDSLTKEDYENGKVKEERLVELSQNELSEEEKKDIANDSRNLLKACFEKYKNKGQIEFVTFHQSYGYEEFVEGIKAISPDDERNPTDNLIYKVEAGIFKKLCENAKIIKAQTNKLDFDWNRGNIFKMSLGGKSDSEILDWCLDNEYISMGWGNEIDFSSITAQSWESFRDKAKSLYQNLDTDRFTLQAMYAFKEWMKKDDLVFVSLGNLKIVAIGQVIGDYEYKENIDEIRYSQFRKVKWLFIDKSGIPVEKLLNKKLSQQTIYNLDKSYVKKDFLDSLFIENNDEQLKNYVLIIDEINRGNISKIFGELITLIEPSKRIGADEGIKVKLPYSGDSEEPFGVPQNLYIIGTMNTADRSIAPIDTARRRRFVFEEMAPNPSLLSKEKTPDIYDGVNLQSLLEAINTRIEYLYDRDHTIGHAYLIDVKTLDDLKFAFKNKIIPLLAEYFYEDWENIDLVLNSNGFIESKKDDEKYLSKKIQDRIRNKTTYKVSDDSTWTKEHFINIYNKNENE